MRLPSPLRPATLVLVGAALLARAPVAAASGTASDPSAVVITRTVVDDEQLPPTALDEARDGEVSSCCPLSGTLPAVGWYGRAFRARSWRELLLPFAGRGEAECP